MNGYHFGQTKHPTVKIFKNWGAVKGFFGRISGLVVTKTSKSRDMCLNCQLVHKKENRPIAKPTSKLFPTS